MTRGSTTEGGPGLLTPLVLLSLPTVHSVCSPQEEQAISACAQPLYSVVNVNPEKFDIFKNSKQQQQFGQPAATVNTTLKGDLDKFAQFTKDYVNEVCGTYQTFDRCVAPYKANCIDVGETQRSVSAGVAEGLKFICGDQYNDALQNSECISKVMFNTNSWECHRVMALGVRNSADTNIVGNRRGQGANTRQQQPRINTVTVTNNANQQFGSNPQFINNGFNGGSGVSAVVQNENFNQYQSEACRVMQDYLTCLRFPVYRDCGDGAWQIVKQIIAKPSQLAMPDCPLRSAGMTGSMGLVVAVTLMGLVVGWLA